MPGISSGLPSTSIWTIRGDFGGGQAKRGFRPCLYPTRCARRQTDGSSWSSDRCSTWSRCPRTPKRWSRFCRPTHASTTPSTTATCTTATARTAAGSPPTTRGARGRSQRRTLRSWRPLRAHCRRADIASPSPTATASPARKAARKRRHSSFWIRAGRCASRCPARLPVPRTSRCTSRTSTAGCLACTRRWTSAQPTVTSPRCRSILLPCKRRGWSRCRPARDCSSTSAGLGRSSAGKWCIRSRGDWPTTARWRTGFHSRIR